MARAAASTEMASMMMAASELGFGARITEIPLRQGFFFFLYILGGPFEEITQQVGAVVLFNNLNDTVREPVLACQFHPSRTWEVIINVLKLGESFSWGLSWAI